MEFAVGEYFVVKAFHDACGNRPAGVLLRAEANVESASAGYVATKVDFLRLVEAQRQLIDLQEKHQDAVAEYHRRRAELERVVGTPISAEPSNESGRPENQGRPIASDDVLTVRRLRSPRRYQGA